MAETLYLVDSNVLLRWVKPEHSDYPAVVSAIGAILQHSPRFKRNAGGSIQFLEAKE